MEKSFAAHQLRTASLDALVAASGDFNSTQLPRVANSSKRTITYQWKDGARWQKISRRGKTTASIQNATLAWLPLRKKIFAAILERMRGAGLDTSTVLEDQYEYCLPKQSSTAEQLHIVIV